MKLIILLLALKGLMPSKKTRKKIAKHIKRARKLKKLTDGAHQKKPKIFGFVRKVLLGLRITSYLAVGISAAVVGIRLFRTAKELADKLPKKSV